MPVYCYKCTDCKQEFEARHSMSFEEQKCIHCGSESIFKVPSLSKNNIFSGANRPGKVVDKYIKDAKQEIQREKIKLKSEEM